MPPSCGKSGSSLGPKTGAAYFAAAKAEEKLASEGTQMQTSIVRMKARTRGQSDHPGFRARALRLEIARVQATQRARMINHREAMRREMQKEDDAWPVYPFYTRQYLKKYDVVDSQDAEDAEDIDYDAIIPAHTAAGEWASAPAEMDTSMGGMGDQNSGDLTIPVEVMDDQNAGDIVDDDATTPACHPSIRKCVMSTSPEVMDDPNAGNIKYVSMIPVEVMDDKNASMVPVNTVAVEWVDLEVIMTKYNIGGIWDNPFMPIGPAVGPAAIGPAAVGPAAVGPAAVGPTVGSPVGSPVCPSVCPPVCPPIGSTSGSVSGGWDSLRPIEKTIVQNGGDIENDSQRTIESAPQGSASMLISEETMNFQNSDGPDTSTKHDMPPAYDMPPMYARSYYQVRKEDGSESVGLTAEDLAELQMNEEALDDSIYQHSQWQLEMNKLDKKIEDGLAKLKAVQTPVRKVRKSYKPKPETLDAVKMNAEIATFLQEGVLDTKVEREKGSEPNAEHAKKR